MGTDETVAKSAWVSTKSITHRRDGTPREDGDVAKVIGYMARHNHWTPFGHCCATFNIKMPVFVARQWMRSNVGIVYNEVSRRYVDDEPEFYWPEKWRPRPDGSMKQGSGSGEITELSWREYSRSYTINPTTDEIEQDVGYIPVDSSEWESTAEDAFLNNYRELLASGVAPEMARMVLPLSMYTEVWMTASLAAYARVCQLRLDPHAQWEIRQYAQALSDLCEGLWPISWAALNPKESPDEAS